MAATRVKELGEMWGILSRKVLATILVDHGALFPVFDVLGPNAHWFSHKEQSLWNAVVQCYQENIPPTVEAVATRSSAERGYVQAVANQWNNEDSQKVLYHSAELKRIGMLADLRSVGRDLVQLDDPAALDTAIEYSMARLSGVAANQTNRSGDAHSVGEAAWAELESDVGAEIPTGLTWFDDLAGGLWPGMNYWIVGAYKMGKTTLMRNILLNTAERGIACDAFCAEGSREMFALDCQAMIATRLMCERGVLIQSNLRLSGLFLRRAWRSRDAVFTAQEYRALKDAREIWNTLNIRVWDTVDGIRNLVTLRHRIQQSRFEFGSVVHWLDYSQLFGQEGTIYERQSRTAQVAQEIAQSEKVAVCILAQRNESAIGGGADNNYSVGVKGGGDASAAADFLLVPSVDHDLDNVYRVKLKHSRHTGLGEGTHIINRSSGLILDRWFKSEADPLNL